MLGRWGLLLCLAALLEAAPAHAERNCWIEAGARYRIDPGLLYAIAQLESGLNPRALGRNRDGSRDVGLMQINSSHLPLLARYGIGEEQLYDPCVSIHVAAWLLAGNFQRMGHSWTAVGAYNAASPGKRSLYASKIYRQLDPQTAARLTGAIDGASSREAPQR
ncbi:lytic transglycosylase domain-containing protein [Ramlibacter humi]|uniref:Lytic transglycosylase n=1 Tax=Ramlibacter humi TaxID=2530451 RepID=A0A4Z0BNR9_9BURK|nr:lytic transglycosylase domain-containing protein [Ramlibacter humi]TFZ00074.1 lytic transglycosylase [Ramlibacter humi]